MRPLSPLPTRIDLEEAIQVYVQARGRVLTHEEKRHLARVRSRRPSAGKERVERASDGTNALSPQRVIVPERLEFHRGAGTWRDSLPRTRHGPEENG